MTEIKRIFYMFSILLALGTSLSNASDFCEDFYQNLCGENAANLWDSSTIQSRYRLKEEVLDKYGIDPTALETYQTLNQSSQSELQNFESIDLYYTLLAKVMGSKSLEADKVKKILKDKVKRKIFLSRERTKYYLKKIDDTAVTDFSETMEYFASLGLPSARMSYSSSRTKLTEADYETLWSYRKFAEACSTDGLSVNAANFYDPARDVRGIFLCPGEVLKSEFNWKYSAYTIAHELGHSFGYVELLSQEEISKASYVRVGECLAENYTDQNGRKLHKRFWEELIADYWASEVLLEVLQSEPSVVEAQKTFTMNFKGMCAESDYYHPDSKTRIETIFLLNPKIRSALGCSNRSIEKNRCFIK